MLRPFSLALVLSALAALPAWGADAPATSLRGSPASMVQQNRMARENDYSFLRSAAQVREFVEKGRLVLVKGDANYRTANVSFPYARPEVATFVERLAAQYREACGEQLVVTSLTRPTANQPRNAHRLSVHPAGMAVDLRISRAAECRAWLEGTLLSLERKGVLDVTRERTPPHYHVAIFPQSYAAYVERMRADSLAEAVAARDREAAAAAVPAPANVVTARLSAVPVVAPAEGGEPRTRSVAAAIALAAGVISLAWQWRVLRGGGVV